MDFAFLGLVAVIFAAVAGLVLACEKLGARK